MDAKLQDATATIRFLCHRGFNLGVIDRNRNGVYGRNEDKRAVMAVMHATLLVEPKILVFRAGVLESGYSATPCSLPAFQEIRVNHLADVTDNPLTDELEAYSMAVFQAMALVEAFDKRAREAAVFVSKEHESADLKGTDPKFTATTAILEAFGIKS